MSKIKGKQLESSSIEQSKINVSRVSVVDNDNVTSKQYVDETIAEKATLYYSKLNLNMQANNTTNVGQKACNIQVIEFPISNVLVKVNGSLVDVGETKDCYFSPDGVIKRTNGLAQKGDSLYWNSTKYNLDTTDEIDFVYLVGYYYYNLSGGTTVELNPVYNSLVVKFTGGDSTIMSVIIDGVTIIVGNVGGQFVWDIGGLDEHTFTSSNESIVVTINGSEYTIWFDGFGSLIFSVKKGRYTYDEPIFNIGNGFDNYGITAEFTENGKMVIGGYFTEYKVPTYNNIIGLNTNGDVNNNFNIGNGFDSNILFSKKLSNDKFFIQGSSNMYNNQTFNNFILLNNDATVFNNFKNESKIGFVSTPYTPTVMDTIDDNIICGQFNLQTNNFNHILSLNMNGTINTNLDFLDGIGGFVSFVTKDNNGKILVGVNFSSYNDDSYYYMVRLNSDGTVDNTFNMGTGFNSWVYCIKPTSDNKILVGGQFNLYNDVDCNCIVRLNSNGSIDSTFNIGKGFNNTVLVIDIQSDNKILVGGHFNLYNGTSTPNIVRLNSDGSIDSTFNMGTGFSSWVSTIEIQSDGKILVGGNFTSYNGTSVPNLIRLNSDGTIDNTFITGIISGQVNSIKMQSDGKILVGCYYYPYFVRLNSDGSLDDMFLANYMFNDVVSIIDIQTDNKIIVGGGFTAFSGITQNRLIRLNSDGSKDESFNINNGFDNDVKTVYIDTDNILCGGYFSSYNPSNFKNIVKFTNDYNVDTTFNVSNLFTDDNQYIKTIVKNDDNSLTIGGYFQYNDSYYNRAILLNNDGTINSGFSIGNGFNGAVQTIEILSNNDILFGGNFTTYSGITQNRLSLLDQSGNLIQNSNIGDGFNNNIYKISKLSDNKILIGGEFTSYNNTTINSGLTCKNIIQINFDGKPNFDFNSNLSLDILGQPTVYSDINTITQLPNGKFLIGGQFKTYSGYTLNRIMCLNEDGTLDLSFNSGETSFNGYVHDIDIQPDNKIIVVGGFTSFNNNSHSGIIRLNSDYAVDNTFIIGSGSNGHIYDTQTQSDNKIILVGGFSSFNGYSRTGVVRLNPDGSVDETFIIGTGFNSDATCIDIQPDGKILIGGNFFIYSGSTQYHIIRLNSDGTKDTSFNIGVGTTANVNTIKIQSDGKILVGGDFYTFNNIVVKYMCRLNSDGSIDTTFNVGSGFDNHVHRIKILSNGKFLVLGEFTTYKGVTSNSVIILNDDGSIYRTFNGFTNGENPIFINASIELSNNNLLIGGDFNIYNKSYLNKIVKLNQNYTIDNTFNIGFGINGTVRTFKEDNNGNLYIGGNFDKYNDFSYSDLVKIDKYGYIDSGFTTGFGFNGVVTAIQILSNGVIVVGGDFTTYNNNQSMHLICLNVDGSVNKLFPYGDTFDYNNTSILSIVEQIDGKILVGGLITTYSGITQKGLMRFNSDFTVDYTFILDELYYGAIGEIILLEDGKILVGGDITIDGGVTYKRMIRLNSDGSIDNSFIIGGGFNNTVRCIKKTSDNMFLVGGDFTTYDFRQFGNMFHLNNDGSFTRYNVPSSNTGFDNGYINIIKKDTNGRYLCGGSFTSYNSQSYNYIIRLNSDYSIDSGFTIGLGFNATVTDIEIQSNGKIVVSGEFTEYDGNLCNYTCRLNSDGTIDNTFNIGTSFDSSITKMELLSSGKIMYYGYFSSFDSNPIERVARLNSDGTFDNTYISNFTSSDSISGLIVDETNNLYVATGSFSKYGIIKHNYIIGLNNDGSINSNFVIGDGLDNTAFDIKKQSDGKLIIGGDFTTYNGTSIGHIARINIDGTLDSTFNNGGSGFDNILRTIQIQTDGKILVGGIFYNYNDEPFGNIIRLNNDGTVDTTFNNGGTGFNKAIRVMRLLTDGKIICAGNFTSYNESSINNVIKLNSDGTVDSSFNVGTGFGIGGNAGVTTFDLQSDGKVIFGGGFTDYNGNTVGYIARLNSDGTFDSTFNNGGTGFDSNVRYIKIQSDGKILVGGWFSTYNDTTVNYFCRLNSDGSLDTTFNSGETGFDSYVEFIAITPTSKILLLGDFTSYNNLPFNRIIQLNMDGSIDTTTV